MSTDAPAARHALDCGPPTTRPACQPWHGRRGGAAENGQRPTADDETPGNPANANRPWTDGQKAALIAAASGGKTFDLIGELLDRTADGCRSELNRLVRGDTPCPDLPGTRTELAAIKSALDRPDPASTRAPSAPMRSLSAAMAAEQYRHLARTVGEIGRRLDDDRRLAEYSFAVGITRGVYDPSELAHMVAPEACRRIADRIHQIKLYRDRMAGIEAAEDEAERQAADLGTRASGTETDETPAAAVEPPGPRFDFPFDPDNPPLVAIGNGDFVVEVWA